MTRAVARGRTDSRWRTGAVALGASILLALGIAAPASAAPADPAKAGPATAHGCTWEPGTTELTLTSGGVERRAVVHVPSGTSPGKRLPVVLNLHGSGSGPEEQMARSGLAATADEEGFVVVAPQGGLVSGAGWAWNVPHVTAAPGAPDDVAFLEDLVESLRASGCVDPRRVYATGYSGGGRMISQVACENPGLFAAIAPVAGLRAGAPLAADSGSPDTGTCAPDAGIPVLTFHGTADVVNWYTGGGLFPYWGYSVPTALERWAEINRCRQETRTTQVTDSVTATSYGACRANADVVLYTVAGGGHTWPGSDPALYPDALLPVTQEIDANAIMWEFFRTRVTTDRV